MNFAFRPGDFKGAYAGNLDKMAGAMTAAMSETAQAAKTAARADIQSAGLGPRFANAMRANVYPSSGKSLSPAALIYNRIPWSEILQTGGAITGSPLLWLPIEANLPGRNLKPADYVRSVGPLVSINIPGKPPMLFAAGRRGPPLYVGVSAVTLAKRLNVDEAIGQEASRLPDRYAAKLKD